MVAILPRGEAIRNFVYSGSLNEVARKVDLTLLSVMPDEAFADVLRSCSDSVIPLHEIPERHFVGSLRELLDMAHGRWLWSEAARERWRLRDAEASEPAARLKRSLMKTCCYPFANPRGLRVLSWIERRTSRAFCTSDEYIRLFQKLKPALVFNGSHVHSRVAIQAVQAAQWLGIPTAAFIFSWDNLTSQGRIMPPYDYYFVWNESIRNQLLEIYDSVKPEQILVTGTPQFDFHFRNEFHWSREEFCMKVGADPSRPIVLYSTGMANHTLGEPAVVERIGALLRGMKDLGSPQLLVRVYPKDLTGRFEQVKLKNPDILFPKIPWEPNWLTPRLEDAHLLTNMLRHAALGINIASTISLELCMFDKPVINVGYQLPEVKLRPEDFDYCRYYEFDHYRPIVESGAIGLARSEFQLQQLVRQALTRPEENALQRRKLVNKMFGDTLDGYSGLRVADRLITLARIGAENHEKELVW